jgi:hypothetical protein
LVYPNSVAERHRPLDMLAIGLSSAMEREHHLNVPVEIPDVLPVSFAVKTDGATSTSQPNAPLFPQRTPGLHLRCQPQPRDIAPDSTPAKLLSQTMRLLFQAADAGCQSRILLRQQTLVGTPRD